MGMWSEEIFEVVCDGSGCHAGSRIGDPATSEKAAIFDAVNAGFKRVDDLWYCEECTEARAKGKK